MSSDIAIVGMACRYGDTDSVKDLWMNVLAQRRAFRRIPNERLNRDDYFHPDPHHPDTVYTDQAAVLKDFEFDRVRYRISGSSYRSADMTHWLALDTAARTLEDAGFPQAQGLPREEVGVLVGNSLTGEFSRAELMRLRWPYVRRTVEARLSTLDLGDTQRAEFLAMLEQDYKAPFQPINEETLAGGLSNTIAGRVCNYFDLGGGGYTVDGACSSSLLAVANACRSLESGDLVAALVGGVDLSLDPFELVGFAKTGALAQECMRVYDRNSSGFWPGEGCGFVLLMRKDDAQALGARCYATIRGWGISSDGSGGLTRPMHTGQLRAIERAYRMAGYGVDEVTLFEGHGTGTSVGDTVELESLREARKRGNPEQSVAYMGSVKANIGHTKAASGVAGLIKAVSALQAGVLPPATGIKDIHPLFEEQTGGLNILSKAQIWPEDRPLKAGVNSFGFGGINVHLALEGEHRKHHRSWSRQESCALNSAQDVELFLFQAADRQGLEQILAQVQDRAGDLSMAELTDLSAHLMQRLNGTEALRAAVVADNPAALEKGLIELRTAIAQGQISLVDAERGLFLGESSQAPRIGLLFPGQAAPVRKHWPEIDRRFPELELKLPKIVEDRVSIYPPTDTRLAQPSIVAAEMAGVRVLQHLGIEACCALGHSLGELMALSWAGILPEEELVSLVTERADLAAATPGEGGMMSILADTDTCRSLIDGLADTVLSCENGVTQNVISGPLLALETVAQRAKTRGILSTRLDVSHAFHSPLMATAMHEFTQRLQEITWSEAASQRKVYSTVIGAPLSTSADPIQLLTRQLVSPVLFHSTVREMLNEADLCIEVGPGRILSQLLADSPTPVISLDVGQGKLRPLLSVVAAAYVIGAPVRAKNLFVNRFMRAFDLDRRPVFLTNPCELPSSIPTIDAAGGSQTREIPMQVTTATAEDHVLNFLRAAVAKRAELPIENVQGDLNLLSDLHLNSITVGQIVVEATRHCQLAPPTDPTVYANSTLEQIAEALHLLPARDMAGIDAEEDMLDGIAPWVHEFRCDWLPVNNFQEQQSPAPGCWQVFGKDTAWLEDALDQAPGDGVVISPDKANPGLLLEAAQSFLQTFSQGCFLLVHPEGFGAAFARSLQQEAGEQATVCVLRGEFTVEAMNHLLRCPPGYWEICVDTNGNVMRPVLRVDRPTSETEVDTFDRDDVVLISGGGKGIATECALALAEMGCRLLLIGRSDPATDEELAENLTRMDRQGIEYRYQRADITDKHAVETAISLGQQSLGAVTAIIHAAGFNNSSLLRDIDEDQLTNVLRPKVDGLRNLLAAVDVVQLRLLVGFGSVIGFTGMRGEADYALANEWLAQEIDAFGESHRHCRCLTMEWSVWAGIGMGERLGHVENLRRQGISPIGIDNGVTCFLRLLSDNRQRGRVVLSGRFPDIPGTELIRPELPLRRFLEKPRVYFPEIELVVDVELSTVFDPYLTDHALDGDCLFPTVMVVEAMTQVASALTGHVNTPRFRNLHLDRPISLATKASEVIRIAALRRGPDCVEVIIRCAATGFQTDHFRGLADFTTEATAAKPLAPIKTPFLVDLSPDTDLYRDLLFHQNRFHLVTSYSDLAATHCTAHIAAASDKPWFGGFHPSVLLLGDPGVRDAAIHSIQVCVPHQRLLPVSVECLTPLNSDSTGPWTIVAQEREHVGDEYRYDVQVYDAVGNPSERWDGLVLRQVAAIEHQLWPLSLLRVYIQRRLTEIFGEAQLEMDIERSEIDPPIRHTVYTRPQQDRSTSHSGYYQLTVQGAAGLACDLETVRHREREIWLDLIGHGSTDLLQRLSTLNAESLDSAATRIWTVRESLKKAGVNFAAPLRLIRYDSDRWYLFASGEVRIASYVTHINGDDGDFALAILVPLTLQSVSKPKQLAYSQ